MDLGWSILVLGFMLGLKHALDADHVVAVSTIISENKDLKKSSLLGIIWGFGHTSTLLFVGVLVLLFKVSIPARMALFMEFLVGIILIILGLSVISGIHFHPHSHSSKKHLHLHSHKLPKSHNHEHKTFIVGVIHGLAGSGALMLIVLATVETIHLGILYILIFGLGSILGMLLVSTLIGIPFVATSNFESLNIKIKAIAGIISIFLGISIIIEIGYFQGLFKGF